MDDARRQEAIEFLNTLLEAERAGVVAVADLERVAPADPDVAALLGNLAEDEARYASGLREQIQRLGGTPSPQVGDFAQKVRELPTFVEKLELLDRGQRWVARRIAKQRSLVSDGETLTFLAEMEVRHELNVARSTQLLNALRKS